MGRAARTAFALVAVLAATGCGAGPARADDSDPASAQTTKATHRDVVSGSFLMDVYENGKKLDLVKFEHWEVLCLLGPGKHCTITVVTFVGGPVTTVTAYSEETKEVERIGTDSNVLVIHFARDECGPIVVSLTLTSEFSLVSNATATALWGMKCDTVRTWSAAKEPSRPIPPISNGLHRAP